MNGYKRRVNCTGGGERLEKATPTLPDQGPPNSVSAVKAWQRVYTLAMSYGILERGTRVRFRSQLQVKVQTDTIFSLQ